MYQWYANFVLSSASRFIGYDSESKELEADKLRQYIVGGHVADYMRYRQDEDEEKFKAHFSCFVKEGVTADSVSLCCHYNYITVFLYTKFAYLPVVLSMPFYC